jgi:hypothetical protein
MVLAADSLAMAEHAVGLGLITPKAPTEIAAEIADADVKRGLPAGESTDRPSVEAPPQNVAQDDLKGILQEGSKTPNVVIGKTGKPPRKKKKKRSHGKAD